jgi:ubiquinone/menaquinone biosynthesis C-methylase UbiE
VGVKEFYNTHAANYDGDHLAAHSSSEYIERRRRELILLALEGCQGKFLDCACGTGYYLELLKGPGRFLVGGDISENMVKVCQEKGVGDVLYVGSYENIPFEDNSFDIILCINSFHYTQRPEESLMEMRRTLKDSGKIILTYFNLFNFRAINLLRRFLFFLDRNTPQAQEHRYTEASIIRMASKAGLKVLSKEGINFLPYPMSRQKRNKAILAIFRYLEHLTGKSFLRHLANEEIILLEKIG